MAESEVRKRPVAEGAMSGNVQPVCISFAKVRSTRLWRETISWLGRHDYADSTLY